MIKIFKPTDKTFTTNGDVVVIPIKAKVHNEDNGDFYLDLECVTKYSDALASNNIIVAPTPQGDQAFRIANPTKSNNKIKLKAWHVYYDSANYLVEDVNIKKKNANEALSLINSGTTPTSQYNTASDITTKKSLNPIRVSLLESLEMVMEAYGGHLVRDNFNISLKNSIGSDHGVVIRYRKNLADMTYNADWDDVCTKLMPIGKDGILLNYVTPSASKFLTASVSYPIPFTKAVSFQQDIDQDDYATEAEYNQALVDDLREQGQAYIDEHQYPQINYTLKANIENVDLGDTVEVQDERIGVDIMTNVISYDYDCILGKYTQLEFGNAKKTLTKLVPNITSTVDQSVYNQITQQISSSVNAITDAEIDDIMG